MHYSLLQRGLIAFSGPDAQTFLNNMLSCDVANLAAERSTYGSFCTPKGRMLASVLLWRTADGFLLQLPAALRESIQKRLAMYILRLKVKAFDATAQYAVYGFAGEGADTLGEKLAGKPLYASHDVARATNATILKLPGDRYELIVPHAEAQNVRTMLQSSAEESSEAWWRGLAIRAGIGCVLPQTQEQFVPQALNLDALGGVSFSKGCYPGQEIVARMHYLGRLKERMWVVHVDGDEAPQPGERIFGADLGDQAAGTIVEAAPASAGGYDALAVIRLSSVEAGPVHWKTPDGPALEILPLPYQLPQT